MSGNKHNNFSNNKNRKIGRPKRERKDVSVPNMARAENEKFRKLYNDAQDEIFRLQNENKDLKQRIKYLETAFESEETIDNATLKRNAINDFIDSVKTLNEVWVGQTC